jgi:uncharacterized repeat protein (TIGR02543 family)
LTLEPDESSKTFTATVSGTRLTALNGWITWTDNTEVRGPGSMAVPPSAYPSPGVPSYTITFDSQGGTEVEPITEKQGTQVPQPEPPQKAEYYFDGWYDAADDEGTLYTWQHTLNADVTMYAHWTEIPTWTISFKNHSDSSVEDTTAKEGTEVVKPIPQKAYHTFDGWFSQADGGDEYTAWPHTLTGNIDMYAHWSPIEFTITFNTHDGSPVGDITQNGGTEVAIPAEPTRANYKFLGWYNAESGGTLYTWPHTLIDQVIMHAQWSPIYKITYELNSGINHTGNPAEYTAEDLPITLKAPTHEGGYIFLYWYADGSPDAPVTTISTGITGAQTFCAKWYQAGETLASMQDIGAYLKNNTNSNSADQPITLPLEINLADGTNGWTALLSAIKTANKFVALDLSDCTMSGAEFDPGTANTGENKIVSLVLPDAATSVKAGSGASSAAFKNFSALKSVTGNNVETIGDYAFPACNALETVNFPNAITINTYAFYNCINLETVSLPNAKDIGMYAFRLCTKLKTIDFPNAKTIGGSAFYDCNALTTISLIKAETIGNFAFENCSLTTVSLPEAISIGQSAFYGCTKLSVLSLPEATSIGNSAFSNTGTTPLTVTLSSTVPSLGTNMFYGAGAKTVTVRVPTAASDNYNTAWINQLKNGNTNLIVNKETY